MQLTHLSNGPQALIRCAGDTGARSAASALLVSARYARPAAAPQSRSASDSDGE